MKVYSFVGLYLEAHERKYVLHMSIRPWKKNYNSDLNDPKST